MFEGYSCFDPDSEDEIDAFKDQAPKRRVLLKPICGYKSDPPLPDNSVRTDSATWIPGIPDDEKCIHATWLRTRRIATSQPRGVPTWQVKERRTTMLAYNYALGLPNTKIASTYRDALVDAVAEHMDDYGFSPGWDVLADATKGHGPCPMRQLVAFQYVLTTDPSELESQSPMRPGVMRLGPIRGKFDACWRPFLDEVRKDGRTYRDIWEDYRDKDRCLFHEHVEKTCDRVAGKSASAEVKAQL